MAAHIPIAQPVNHNDFCSQLSHHAKQAAIPVFSGACVGGAVGAFTDLTVTSGGLFGASSAATFYITHWALTWLFGDKLPEYLKVISAFVVGLLVGMTITALATGNFVGIGTAALILVKTVVTTFLVRNCCYHGNK